MSPLTRELLDQMLQCASQNAENGHFIHHTLQVLKEAREFAGSHFTEFPEQRAKAIEDLAYMSAVKYNLGLTDAYFKMGRADEAKATFEKASSFLEKISKEKKPLLEQEVLRYRELVQP